LNSALLRNEEGGGVAKSLLSETSSLHRPPSCFLRGVFLDVKHILRTAFGANAASNALGRLFRFFRLDNKVEWTGFHTLSTAITSFFVDQIHAFGILRNGFLIADFPAFAALDTRDDFDFAFFSRFHMNTGQILGDKTLVFVKCLSADIFTGKTVHTGAYILNRYLFHTELSSGYAEFGI
jgi:hypothetical protein